MATSASQYDTIWYKTDKEYDPNITLDVNYYESSSANPEVIKRTKDYILLNRNFDSYNKKDYLYLHLVGYGKAFENKSIQYKGTTFNTGSGLGKILFKTSSAWILWDLDNKKVVQAYDLSYDIVDYNYTLSRILIQGSEYLYFYDEDLIYQGSAPYNSRIYYGNNFHMASDNNTIGFYESYYLNAGEGYTITSAGGTSSYTDGYTMYNFHSNGSGSAVNYVYHQYYNGQRRLKYTLSSGTTGIAKTSSYGFGDIEISRDGNYLAYVDLYNQNTIEILNTSSKAYSYLTSLKSQSPLAINDESTHIVYVKSTGALQLYDLSKKTSSSPLDGTSYANATITEIYW